MNSRRVWMMLVALLLSTASFLTAPAIQPGSSSVALAAGGTTYYVDCNNGGDGRAGTSPATAWRSLDRANQANLAPGNALLLKRGCVWRGPLNARWTGTEANPIRIGAYGTGQLPKVQNAYSANVQITGAYQIVELIQTAHAPSSYDRIVSSCNNQPVGWKLGFSFSDGAHHNTLRRSLATKEAIGVNFTDDAHHNHVLNNRLVGNNGMWEYSENNSLGGTAVLLHGNANEIAYNFMQNNKANCMLASISIELYNATNSNVHHNKAYGDRVFVEMGSSSAVTSAGNIFAYNIHSTSAAQSRFVVTRGAGHEFGPVWGTTLFNNVAYLTGSESEGVVCQLCAPAVLKMKNNIIVARDKALYIGDGQSLTEANNIYWTPGGGSIPTHFVQNWNMDSTSRFANPQFVNAGSRNFHLRSTSPAMNKGSMNSVNDGYARDMDGHSVPLRGAVDIGVDEVQ